LALKISDWLRMLAHIDTGNRKLDPRGNRTHNLAVWTRTRYQYATTSLPLVSLLPPLLLEQVVLALQCLQFLGQLLVPSDMRSKIAIVKDLP
jgi:hypothetical protein